MNEVSFRLKSWLRLLQDLFGNKVPSYEFSDTILTKVLARFRVELTEFIGTGDNGIVFLTNTNEVVKFTIDKEEAYLWHRLKGKELAGLTGSRDVVNLSSSVSGDSIIYAIKAEYAPNPITPEQESMIRQAKAAADKEMQQRVRQVSSGEITSDQYVELRTLSLINQFQEIADLDNSLAKIPNMLMDLADLYGGHVYDLQPANFKRDLNGNVVLIDPSVPNLFGKKDKPEELRFEHKVALAIEVGYIIVD